MIRKFLPEALVILALLFAFIHATQTTADLHYSYNPDLYRDSGTAETILNGRYPADPLYLGERAWYNPLVPSLVAGISRITHQPIYLLYAQIGGVLNLLAPITFYVAVALWFNRWTALISLLGYLFIVGNGAGSYYATYTPWLFPSDFAQGLFFLGLIVYWQALHSGKIAWYALFGGILGLTFLAHTAPAVILGGIFALTLAQRLFAAWDDDLQSPALYRILWRGVVALGVAFVVGLPLIMTIVGYYGMEVSNHQPVNYRSPLLDITHLNDFIRTQITLWTLIASIGLFHLLKRQRNKPEVKQVIATWFLIAAGLLLYDYGVQLLGRLGISFSVFITSWHFLLYLELLKSVLFGYGLSVIAQLIVGVANQAWARIPQTPRTVAACLAALTVILLVVRYPHYAERSYLTAAREEALRVQTVMTDRVAAFQWIKAHTGWEDVFLVEDTHLAMFAVAQAGGKLVVAPPTFSNPYVDYEARAHDQATLFEAITADDEATFAPLAKHYHLRYVIVSGERRIALEAQPPTFLTLQFAEGDVALYAYTSPSPTS